MSVNVIPKSQQAPGQFNNGGILERRPVVTMRGFPNLKPYSTLFYWAYAWSEKGSTIGEHPHQGFEIMSFVVEGDIEHYDTHNRTWKKLKKGDAQIIRSGSGISHSEKINSGSAIFQIWLDPDINKAIEKPASYDDYASEVFPIVKKDGVTVKTYHGGGAPMQLNTEGAGIHEIWLKPGVHPMSLQKDSIHSFFLIEGGLKIGSHAVEAGDFFVAKEEASLDIGVNEEARLFHLMTPAKPSYHTYAEMMGQ